MSEIDLCLFSKIKIMSFYDHFVIMSFWKDRQNFLLMEGFFFFFFLNEHENIFSVTFFVLFLFSVQFILL